MYVYKGRWGFIDEMGKIIVKFKFEWVEDFLEGLVVVK